ncbi:MAG: hypothetical protein MOGMAGMI_01643 [Candidatus Omnitrophica bacterium]|nr:hypothetical protein [Candidatus Omnitrophota bacterium]
MDLKLPFGLKNGQLVQVSDVESGLNCGCSCPACGDSLVARKGKIKIHHFAHHNSDCIHGFETAIHLAAKKIIEEAGYIRLPKLECTIISGRQNFSFDETVVHFDKIYLEKRHHDIVPDIVLEKDGRILCVEIFVTHKVDEEKRTKIRQSNTSAIEIDLSEIDRTIDFELLKEKVVESAENKEWIFNSSFDSKRSALHKLVLENSMKKDMIQRGMATHIDYCPIRIRVWQGKPYANFIDDCIGGCKNFVMPKGNFKDDWLGKGFDYTEDGMIYCIGHKTDEEINKILNGNTATEKDTVSS